MIHQGTRGRPPQLSERAHAHAARMLRRWGAALVLLWVVPCTLHLSLIENSAQRGMDLWTGPTAHDLEGGPSLGVQALSTKTKFASRLSRIAESFKGVLSSRRRNIRSGS